MVTGNAIFHLTGPETWDGQCHGADFTESTRDATLQQVGFIHCSYADQVELVANAIYRTDWPGELLLLEIDATKIDAPIRVENLDGGELRFPHIYGPLPVAAVSAVHQMIRDGDRWVLPSDLREEWF